MNVEIELIADMYSVEYERVFWLREQIAQIQGDDYTYKPNTSETFLTSEALEDLCECLTHDIMPEELYNNNTIELTGSWNMTHEKPRSLAARIIGLALSLFLIGAALYVIVLALIALTQLIF